MQQQVKLPDLISGKAPAQQHGGSHHHGFDSALESYDFHGDSLPRKHTEFTKVGPDQLFAFGGMCLDDVARMSLFKWALTLLAAIVIAFSAGALVVTSHEIVHTKVLLMDGFFHRGEYGYAFLLWVGYGTVATGLAASMVCYLEPSAGGSGIPDVKSYCNGVVLPGVLRFRTYCIRIVGLILITSSGLFAGTEGPMAHVGAIVAAGLSMGRFTLFGQRLALTDSLNQHRVKLEFMGMGAAMGVAAAFGAPIGGLLFSLEEASTHWNIQLTWRTFFGACIASMMAKTIKRGFQGIALAGFIEFPAHNARSLPAIRDIDNMQQTILGDPVQWQPWELIPFVFIAFCLGLLGANFCWFVKQIQMLRMKVFNIGQKGKKLKRGGRVAEAVVIAMFSLSVTYALSVAMPCLENEFLCRDGMPSGGSWSSARYMEACPDYVGLGGATSSHSSSDPSHSSGRLLQAADMVQDRHNAYLNFRMHMFEAHCEPGKSSSVAMYFFESREFAIKALFSDEMKNGVFSNSQLVVLVVSTYFLTLMTYGAGIPAGLFIPNIMTGACFGRLVGQWVQEVVGGMDPSIHVNPGVYALIGATAMLAGFTRMTMSLGVIVLEITTNMFMTLPVMLVIVVAKATGDLFTASTYDIVIALKNIPLLEPEIETKGWAKLGDFPVRGIGCPQADLDFIEFGRFRVQDAVEKLLSSRHHAWPVVESRETMRLLGLLTRPKMLDCLEKDGLLDSGNLDRAVKDGRDLDVWPFVSRDPFILLHRTSVLSAHRTFRMLGLRHLCIVDEKHSIVSFVTRTDLCEVVEHFVSNYKVALKDFAEEICRAGEHELDERPDRVGKGGVAMPDGVGESRAQVRERRQRAHSEASSLADAAVI